MLLINYPNINLQCCSQADQDLKEELIGAIKEELSTIFDDRSLQEAIELVDLVQRLGIQRFFESEIEAILRSAYR